MANFTCDGMTLDIPDAQAGIVDGWIKKRNSQIDRLHEIITKLHGDASQSPDSTGQPWIVDTGMEYDSVKSMYDAFCKMAKDYKDLQAKSSEKDSKCDSLKGQVEGLKATLAERSDTMDSTVLKARVKLQTQALKYLPRTFNGDSLCDLSDRQIKEQVISYKWSQLADTLTERSDSEVNGIYIAAITNPPKAQDSSDALSVAISGISTVEKKDEHSYIKNIENAWKNG